MINVRDRLISECLGKKLEVASPIKNKMKENQFRWFGHGEWRPITAPIRLGYRIIVSKNMRTRPC